MSETTTVKALDLLKTNKTVAERAEKYVSRIGESLKIKMIVPLKEQIAKIEDEIFDLENFSLDTNLNKGLKQMTKEDCEQRFETIIQKTFEKEILELELRTKTEKFEELFGAI